MKLDLRELLQEAGQGVTLSTPERERLERVVMGYAEMKPIRAPERSLFAWNRFGLMLGRVRLAGVYALLALVFLSGSVSYAAEGSLPGDTLYPVKVSINEELRTAFALTPFARATWTAARAERRLEEAVALARDGLLTPEMNAFIATIFAEQADEAAQSVNALEAEDAPAAISLASRFETRVAAHDALLADLTTNVADENLKKIIVEKTAQITALRTHAEEDASVRVTPVAAPDPTEPALTVTTSVTPTIPPATTTAVDPKKQESQKNAALAANAAALKQLDVAKQLFGVASPTLTAADAARVSADIAAATNAIADGDALLASGNYMGAYQQYHQAVTTADQLSVYLKAAFELKIRVLPLGL